MRRGTRGTRSKRAAPRPSARGPREAARARPPVGLALLALLLLVPPAAAHTTEEPLPIEAEVLADEGEDAFYWYDGYDLWNLFVREAFWEPEGAEGLIFRFTLYGGFAPQQAAQELRIGIGFETPDGERRVIVATADDRDWAGDDVSVIAANITADDLPWTGVTARLQVFASYETLGLAPGQAISDITMWSWSDEEVLDVAPGGLYPPGTGGRAEVPTESARLVETLDLVGPLGYANVSWSVRGENLTFRVVNPFPEQGQHVAFWSPETPGWRVDGPAASHANVAGGKMHNFTVRITAFPDAALALPIEVRTDVGGRERFWVGVNGSGLEVSRDAATLEVVPVPPSLATAPAIPTLVGLGAVLAAVPFRGRHRGSS